MLLTVLKGRGVPCHAGPPREAPGPFRRQKEQSMGLSVIVVFMSEVGRRTEQEQDWTV